jgi:hypothetical protein
VQQTPHLYGHSRITGKSTFYICTAYSGGNYGKEEYDS